LHIVLREIAHVALDHGKRLVPRHAQEHEAEQWAFEIMRRISVPRKSPQSAKAYVGHKIRQAIKRT
jgi:hypothetical protein